MEKKTLAELTGDVPAEGEEGGGEDITGLGALAGAETGAAPGAPTAPEGELAGNTEAIDAGMGDI